MLAKVRLIGKVLLIAVYTLPLILFQEVALRTGWWSDRSAPRLWHRLTLKVLGISVRLTGLPATERPLLIVSNHVSWTDILVLGSITGVHFVAKSEMRGWPVLGTFARLQRSVFVERERKRATPEQARELAERLSSGDPMVLFAEGTTGDGNRVLPFKSTLFGAAKLALESMQEGRVLVQPVAIAYLRRNGLPLDRRERGSLAWIGNMDFVPHLLALLGQKAIDVEVRFGEPIPFSADGDRKAVALNTERRVRQMLVVALRQR
ncbi:1-acyl-sn-glycerol-3-phosphate acyltransferase [Chelativorans sp. AA-79]|uniref:lysophospholipid acyltransferase family protein n=1 Tax=Chelativorans sp. AA-79 TaxID=3028735 RepID=UPI0023FA2834|nr:1-acyl-sn-glycerol-3-phosphate acyltransferase [Chelativorans sp. AA-79]WEX09253.1 1-acyl-sn-glycerol-3-phosphate acyltransferase [Chelativorans sp. AA-79]